LIKLFCRTFQESIAFDRGGVQCEGFFASIDVDKGTPTTTDGGLELGVSRKLFCISSPPRTGNVRRSGVFYFDHFRTHVGQQRTSAGSGDDGGQFNDTKPRQ